MKMRFWFCSASDSTILHNVGKDFVQKKSQYA